MNSQPPQPKISYPTTWTYKIIGEDEAALRLAAATVLGTRSHQIEFSNTSSAKRYISLRLRVRVEDAAIRVSIFEQLKGHEAVKIVL